MQIFPEEPQRSAAASDDSSLPWLAMWLAVTAVAILAIHRLNDFPAKLDWRGAIEGASSVAGATVWAAVRVWLFWGASTVALGLSVLRYDPDLELSDAILIGAAGLWVLAPMVGNLLGPLGLLSDATVFGMLAVLAGWLWRKAPAVRPHALTVGQKLALLATGLLGVSYLPLQFASPIVPFMDVLS